jgi:hypothetical protein
MARVRLFHEPHYDRVPLEAMVEGVPRVDVWEVLKGGKDGQRPTREADLLINGISIALDCGFSDLVGDSWTGIAAPAGVPPAISGSLDTANNTSLKSRGHGELCQDGSQDRRAVNFGVFLAEERKRWADFVRVSGVELEHGKKSRME